ncbi:MAG: YjfB family protein [Clostridium sp.]|uniref:YjfB family protein n=1 Tax=Clostridium sp. TaxID=1506 RepID=UPI003D6D231A
MDIGALSMIMSQSRVQQSASIAVMKIAMNTGKENAIQMTEMIKNVAVDSNVGQNLDTRA